MTSERFAPMWTRGRALAVVLVGAAVLLLAGCMDEVANTAGLGGGAGSSVIASGYDSGGGISLPDRFGHEYHFSHRPALVCADCHTGAVHGTAPDLTPPMTACLTCHAGDMHESAHVQHLGSDPAALGADSGIVCVDCHGEAARTVFETDPRCQACHAGDVLR